MNTKELLVLALAGVAVFLIARRVTGGTIEPSGWRDMGDGTRIDPQGNQWWGNQMIWKAPTAIETVGQGGALTEPVWI